jgi:hypothetical protein
VLGERLSMALSPCSQQMTTRTLAGAYRGDAGVSGTSASPVIAIRDQSGGREIRRSSWLRVCGPQGPRCSSAMGSGSRVESVSSNEARRPECLS